MGERFSHLKAWDWPVSGLHKDPGALQDTAPGLFPGSSSPPAGLRLGDQEGPGGKARICLFLHHLPDDHHSTAG